MAGKQESEIRHLQASHRCDVQQRRPWTAGGCMATQPLTARTAPCGYFTVEGSKREKRMGRWKNTEGLVTSELGLGTVSPMETSSIGGKEAMAEKRRKGEETPCLTFIAFGERSLREARKAIGGCIERAPLYLLSLASTLPFEEYTFCIQHCVWHRVELLRHFSECSQCLF